MSYIVKLPRKSGDAFISDFDGMNEDATNAYVFETQDDAEAACDRAEEVGLLGDREPVIMEI